MNFLPPSANSSCQYLIDAIIFEDCYNKDMDNCIVVFVVAVIIIVILHLSCWQEFEKIPMFMTTAPSEIDPKQNPDLACLQSIIFDEEQTPEGTFYIFVRVMKM